jgi:hypothetical protein
MSTSADLPELALAARIKKGFALQAGSELQITYDGTTPPLALFRELAALGWDHAVPAPPPAHAIDWSRSDPVTGTRHSVRPFQALTTATIQGPDEVRARAIEAAREVLARYGALGDGFLSQGDAGGERAAPGWAQPPTSPEATGAVAAMALEQPTTGPEGVRVELVVDDGDVARVRAAIGGFGEVCGDRPDVWSTTITYRGHRTDETHAVRRLEVVVAEADYPSLLAELARFRVHSVARAA